MRFWASLFACLIIGSVSGQSVQVVDSLEQHLHAYSPTEKAYALFTLVSYYQRSDKEKMSKYRKESAGYLTHDNPYVQTYVRIIEGIYFTGTGSLDSAEYWFTAARKSAEKMSDNHHALSIICSSLGRTLVAQGKAEAAVSSLVEGLQLTDNDSTDRETAMKIRINLTWAYLELKRYRDGINLGLQTLHMMDSSLQWMALYLYNNMAVCYGATGKLDSARYFVEKGIAAAEKNHDYQSLANAHFILGTIYGNAGRNDLAISQYEMAKPFREKIGNPFYIVSDLYTLSSLYKKTGNYQKGIQTGLEALAVAEENHLLLKFENTYEVLASNYEGLHDYRNASKYYQLWAVVKDSVYKNANARAIADMETKYETGKKVHQIALQTATIRAQQANIQRNYILIGGLIIVVILVVIILFLIRSRMRRKQEGLQREYELSLREAFISASIQSQEHERKRFAQDLHDGMGQLISGLRFLLIGRRQEESAAISEQMTKVEHLLNDMHQEIRDIAFNLMPQTLIKSGLIPAIQEMGARIKGSGQATVTVSSFSMPGRLSEVQEISLYRIVQEWVNNVLKYSGATTIQIQLVAHEADINLTIEDNGNGFDKRLLENSQGNGWRNIQSRLNLIKGTLEIDTQVNRKGTTLALNMPLSL